MSTQNHPNLHAVGLTCDIIESIAERLRGAGLRAGVKEEIMGAINKNNQIVNFVSDIEETIDEVVLKSKGASPNDDDSKRS